MVVTSISWDINGHNPYNYGILSMVTPKKIGTFYSSRPNWDFTCPSILGVTTRPGKRLQFAIENGPVEIVDLPIKNGDFP